MKKALSGIAFVLTMAVFATTAFAQTGILKKPYLLFPGQNTQMEVLWQDQDTETTNTLSWGTDTNYRMGTVTVPELPSTSTVPHQHLYIIKGLEPNRKYYYQVADATNGVYGTGSFITAPHEHANHVKFLAAGDSRSQPFFLDAEMAAMRAFYMQPGNEEYQRINILNGDWVSSDKESYWTSQFFDPTKTDIVAFNANTPLNGCKGNHDDAGGYSATFPKYFPYPYPNLTPNVAPLKITDSTGNQYYSNLYWSFDYGPVHFTFIDEYSSMAQGSAQYNWVVNDLATTTKPWKIVVYHEASYSAGADGDNGAVRIFEPFLTQYNVDLVYSGHSHNYARAGAYNSLQANGDQIALNIPHVTSGGGGAPIYQPDLTNNPADGWPHVITGWPSLEFMAFDVNGDTLTYTAYQVNNAVTNGPSTNLTTSKIETVTLHHFQNITSQVTVKGGAVKCDKVTTLCSSELEISNSGHGEINGLINVVLDGVLNLQGIGNADNEYSTAGENGSSAGKITSMIAQNTGLYTDVTLVNATGSQNGEPMIQVGINGLHPHDSVRVPLVFANPNNETISFCQQGQLPYWAPGLNTPVNCINPVVYQNNGDEGDHGHGHSPRWW
jgi:predicted phosphodiesterase